LNERDKITIFWFRRDLRLNDNTGLYHALKNNDAVLPLFIFDSHILDPLPDLEDRRVSFIYHELQKINSILTDLGSTLIIKIGDPLDIWKFLVEDWNISSVYTNTDYEPYAIERDDQIKNLLREKGIAYHSYKDQVIFEKDEILKDDGKPYSVFTPFKSRWLDTFAEIHCTEFKTDTLFSNFQKTDAGSFPSPGKIGFKNNKFRYPPAEVDTGIIQNYHKTRDFPAIQGTSRIGLHLRFGTISIRELVKKVKKLNSTFLSELIWREFFMMILYHHPRVANEPFKLKYRDIQWINDENHFRSWCEGKTGYPMVDAGMRELNKTGYMHNRVRMITASFLTKHLLVDWRWGEKYFADKLLDFELSSNNGNWQWAAGCGCDAAPYFRIFNPTTQIKKFDPDRKYIKKWVPEHNDSSYPKPVIEHKFARERALEIYARAVK
jgi:deoxyribodipyrimidine photo-lyase